MKIKAKTKDCRLLVKVKLSKDELMVDRDFQQFSGMMIRGLMRPTIESQKVIIYTGPVGVALNERLKTPISKREFLFIIEQFVVATQKVLSNNLSMSNMLLDSKYIYINTFTKELQFIYLPYPVNRLNFLGAVISCIDSVLYSARPELEPDMEYITRFAYFLKSLTHFDVSALEKFVQKEDPSVITAIRRQYVGQSGFMTNKKKSYYEHYANDGARDEATGLLEEDDTGLLEDDDTGLLEEDDTGLLEDDDTGLLVENSELMSDDSNDKTGLLDEDDGTGLLNDNGCESSETIYSQETPQETWGYQEDATGLLNEDDFGDTGLLEEEDTAIGSKTPYIMRKFNEERVAIKKSVFRIGKERNCADFYIANDKVSRNHADIVTRGTQYYIIDLNSTNYTYLNGKRIPAQCEVELRDGDLIRLANEEFLFSIL